MSDPATLERWLPVVDFEGNYEVSDLGRVRSVDRWLPCGGRGVRFWPSQIMRLGTARWGHQTVNLKRDGRQYMRYVHGLVLTAFVGPRPVGLECCHGNGDASDNRLANLRWDSSASNKQDMLRHGTHEKSQRTRCPRDHALVAPNLVPAKLATGVRECHACSKARSAVRYARTRSIELDFVVEADRRYLEIMAATSASSPVAPCSLLSQGAGPS